MATAKGSFTFVVNTVSAIFDGLFLTFYGGGGGDFLGLLVYL